MQTSKDRLLCRIVLPFPLPTWNRLLGVNRWQRKKIRDWIHKAVSCCEYVPTANGSPMLMVSAQKLQSTGLSIEGFLALMGRSQLRKSHINRSSRASKKQ